MVSKDGDIMMLFGDRVRTRRLELNMTQEELGKAIGVSKVAISGYENGNRTPKLDIIAKLASVLNLEIGYLLGQDVSVICEGSNLNMMLPKDDIVFLNELKKNKKLYKMLTSDPQRMIKLVSNKLLK